MICRSDCSAHCEVRTVTEETAECGASSINGYKRRIWKLKYVDCKFLRLRYPENDRLQIWYKEAEKSYSVY
jgi:hypothetical protein